MLDEEFSIVVVADGGRIDDRAEKRSYVLNPNPDNYCRSIDGRGP